MSSQPPAEPPALNQELLAVAEEIARLEDGPEARVQPDPDDPRGWIITRPDGSTSPARLICVRR